MRRLLAGLVLLLQLPGAVALAQPAATQNLKLVMQAAGLGAFDAAAWTPDGRWLVEVSGHERLVRIWDPEARDPYDSDLVAGTIVDSIRLPLPGERSDETLAIEGIRVMADGRRALVQAVVLMENPAMGPTRYESVDFDVDLVGRKARPVATSRQPGQGDPVPTQGEVPDIDAGRPVLPIAPDGRRLVRDTDRVRLFDSKGKELGRMTLGSPVQTRWASISPDGSTILFLSPKPEPKPGTGKAGKPAKAAEPPEPIIRLVALNISAGQTGPYGQTWDNFANYGRFGFAGDGRVLLSEESRHWGRRADIYPDAEGEPAVAWLIDLTGAREPFEVAPRCFVQPLGRDFLVGVGLSTCRHGVPRDTAIWARPLEGEWQPLPLSLKADEAVTGLRASADGKLIAISVAKEDLSGGHHLLVVDAASARTLHKLEMPGLDATAFAFLPDGRSLLAFGGTFGVHWRFAEGTVQRLPTSDVRSTLIVSDGQQALFGGVMNPSVQRVALGHTPQAQTALDVFAPVAGGFVQNKPILWVSTYNGELILYDSRDWSLIATVRRFHDDKGEEYFIVHDPSGRYDSNLPPDYAPFRWLVADAPFQSLGPQTFMRELYTPDLLARLLDCVPQRSCAKALPVALKVSELNRTLPEVTAVEVLEGARPGTVDVEVRVKEGENSLPSGAYGRSRSGMHNLRLFRDGVLVAEAGAADPGLDPADKAGWRKATQLLPTPNEPDGAHVALFRGLRLPTGTKAEEATFSAYAFNEDRVRGEENSSYQLDPPLARKLNRAVAAPRGRRLFLISIGVDAYPGGVFRPLRYAVADARAMGRLFAEAFVDETNRPRMQVVRIAVEGTAEAPATRARIEAAFARLAEATPDDMVVVSFSGHGYTDARGRFFLVPSDVRSDGDRPVAQSMIGADDLARWLMPVDAGAIHVVIDACHSAASVQAGGFKPGPMGDPGLGQLAYDKGIRILSASAPDQYAMEDTRLGHGLLTYALVVEGAREGRADNDGDGVIGMDELMAYAVKRLPRMSDPTDPLDGPGLVVEWAGPPVPRQTPKLFDFAGDYSPLVIVSKAPG